MGELVGKASRPSSSNKLACFNTSRLEMLWLGVNGDFGVLNNQAMNSAGSVCLLGLSPEIVGHLSSRSAEDSQPSGEKSYCLLGLNCHEDKEHRREIGCDGEGRRTRKGGDRAAETTKRSINRYGGRDE